MIFCNITDKATVVGGLHSIWQKKGNDLISAFQEVLREQIVGGRVVMGGCEGPGKKGSKRPSLRG